MSEPMFLSGKTAVVTGSTSGIGLAYATALAGAGANVMLNGFGEADAIAGIVERLSSGGARVLHDGADVTQADEVERMIARAADELGSVDVLVNNAGVQHVAAVEQLPLDKWDLILGVNLSAAFYAIRSALPLMRAKGWGRIISTASAHSLVASPNKAAYVASKHGLAGLTKSVALECARDGVTVNCVSPGYVWTTLIENQIPDTMATRGLTREQVVNDVLLAAQPTKAFVTPEQVAALGLYLCRDEAAAITGANLSVDGGWTAA